jgi:hypothetical protein
MATKNSTSSNSVMRIDLKKPRDAITPPETFHVLPIYWNVGEILEFSLLRDTLRKPHVAKGHAVDTSLQAWRQCPGGRHPPTASGVVKVVSAHERARSALIGQGCASDMAKPVLLSIVEMGGYPDFRPLYQRAGFEVVVEHRMRKAMSVIKKVRPRVIVAEFNFQSDFRDRTSSLESMLSVVERLPDTRVIVFYDKEYQHQFDRLLAVRRFYRTFTFPIPEQELMDAVQALAEPL